MSELFLAMTLKRSHQIKVSGEVLYLYAASIFLTHQGTINSRQKNNQIPLISTAASSTVLWGDLFLKKHCAVEKAHRESLHSFHVQQQPRVRAEQKH